MLLSTAPDEDDDGGDDDDQNYDRQRYQTGHLMIMMMIRIMITNAIKRGNW